MSITHTQKSETRTSSLKCEPKLHIRIDANVCTLEMWYQKSARQNEKKCTSFFWNMCVHVSTLNAYKFPGYKTRLVLVSSLFLYHVFYGF